MITYLQDRLLDNFEDEIEDIKFSHRIFLMDKVVEIFDPANEDSQEALNLIMKNASLLEDKGLRRLTENADILKKAFNSLETEVKEISYNWLKEMNQGMKKYLKKSVKTFSDLNDYCYYVAGTVGGFLTEVIIHKENLSKEREKCLKNNFNEAGLFLQKVNIIRDFQIDLKERGKSYWPVESLGTLENELIKTENKQKALKCLNMMIENVRKHIPAVIEYYQALPSSLPGFKKFYCVNKALGMATLDKMEDNPKIFYDSKKVKVPKWEFLKIIKSPEKYFEKNSRKYSA